MAKTYRVKLELDSDELRQVGGGGGGDDTIRRGGVAAAPVPVGRSGVGAGGAAATGAAVYAGAAAAGGAARRTVFPTGVPGMVVGPGAAGLAKRSQEDLIKAFKASGASAKQAARAAQKIKKMPQALPLTGLRQDPTLMRQLADKQEKMILDATKKQMGDMTKPPIKKGFFRDKFDKFKGLGAFGKATAITGAATAIAVVVKKLVDSIIALGQRLSEFSGKMADVMLKHEVAMEFFNMDLGDALAPFVSAITTMSRTFLDMFRPLFPLFRILGASMKQFAQAFRLVGLLFRAAFSVFEPILRVIAEGMEMLADAMEAVVDAIEALLGMGGGGKYTFSDQMRSFLEREQGGHGAVGDLSPSGSPASTIIGNVQPGAEGAPGAAGVPGFPGAAVGFPIPLPIPAATPNIYMGLSSTIQTRQCIEESIKAFRNHLLADLNQSENKIDMFMNELKSLNYIRII